MHKPVGRRAGAKMTMMPSGELCIIGSTKKQQHMFEFAVLRVWLGLLVQVSWLFA